MDWTEERVEQLRSLLAGGLSASAIGAAMGVTRNAIIGKVHRLACYDVNLAFKNSRGGNQERHKGPRRSIPRPRRAAGPSGPQIMNAKTKTRPRWAIMDLEPETVENPICFVELEAHHCRWPVTGEGHNTLFCGADAIDKLPYCQRHCRLAYQEPHQRQSRAAFELHQRELMRLFKTKVQAA